MKGIILAGGASTRLFPCNLVTSKQLLPVYDKPMIYYPLSTLMLAGIKDILIISTPEDTPKLEKVLGHGERLGIELSYKVQEKPEGIAQAFIIGEKFIGPDHVCLILGDNLFYGHGLSSMLQEASLQKVGATIFGYSVKDPERYGVVEIEKAGRALSLEEKPSKPKSEYAVPGIYFYDNQVVDITKKIKPSPRGELEITDVNKKYLEKKELIVKIIGRGIAWLDTGTPDSLLDASSFIATIERRQGLKIACIEEIAYRMDYINKDQLIAIVNSMPGSAYSDYLRNLL